MTLVSRPLTPSLSPKGEGKGVFLFSRGNGRDGEIFLKEEDGRMLFSTKRAGHIFFFKEAGHGDKIFPSPQRGEGQGEGEKGVKYGESLGI